MNKTLLAVIALLGLCAPARAQTLTNAQAVKIVVPYVTQCSTASVSTSTTEVTGNTSAANTTYGASAVKIVNQDTTNNVCCSENASVSCSVADVIAPSVAAPYNWTSWAVSVTQKWYCVAAAATAKILICRVK